MKNIHNHHLHKITNLQLTAGGIAFETEVNIEKAAWRISLVDAQCPHASKSVTSWQPPFRFSLHFSIRVSRGLIGVAGSGANSANIAKAEGGLSGKCQEDLNL